VFFDDVRIPVENRVGEENDGWRVTNVTLSFERGTAFVSDMVDAMRLIDDLARFVHDGAQRRSLGHVAAEFDALWALTKRIISQSARRGTPGEAALVFKLAYSEAGDHLWDLAMEVLGREGLTASDQLTGMPFVEERLRTLAIPIAAGSSQIQRNIIGERLLGLPRERSWV